MIIGVTDDRVNEEKYLLYDAWLRAGDPDAEILRLTPREGNGRALLECDALVLTGGGDLDPRMYGESPAHGTLYGISPERDAFEAALVKAAFESGVPVLGICRGLQLVNVVLGGTLITDLEEAGHPPHRTVDGVKCTHLVRLERGSRLAARVGVESGRVASSHHQAAGRIGAGLTVAARSEDGVVEALELTDPDGRTRALLVQWHPERMSGTPLSEGLRDHYFNSLTSK